MIKEVTEAIQEKLLTVLSDLGIDEVPSFGLGEGALAGADTTPRIIWVPQGGPVNVAKKNGGDMVRNPGALWGRRLQVNAHIWAEDITAAEVLANHLVAAVHWNMVGSYAVLQESWITTGATAEGVCCVLTFEMRMPFTRETLPEVTATPVITSQVVHS